MYGPGLEIKLAIQVPGLDWESDPGPFGTWADTLTAEPHQPGLNYFFKNMQPSRPILEPSSEFYLGHEENQLRTLLCMCY